MWQKHQNHDQNLVNEFCRILTEDIFICARLIGVSRKSRTIRRISSMMCRGIATRRDRHPTSIRSRDGPIVAELWCSMVTLIGSSRLWEKCEWSPWNVHDVPMSFSSKLMIRFLKVKELSRCGRLPNVIISSLHLEHRNSSHCFSHIWRKMR